VGGKMSLMSRNSVVLRWLPAVVMMAIIFLLSSLPSDRIPYYGAVDTFVKKGGHAIGYGLLGLSYFYALPKRLSKFYRVITALMMAILFALSDEYHQSFVQGRSSSLGDVLIDGIGAVIALVLGTSYSSNSRSNSKS
jgi:VanZ family protein